MPKNVMKLLKHTANYARHSFDLSHRHLITANFGELLPSTFIEVVPDDYIEFSASDLLRAIPMVTSPFLRAKQHIDVWYVPYDYLWSNFTAFMTQKSQPTSAALKAQAFVPHADINYITGIINQSGEYDVIGQPYSKGAKKIFDLCGYGRTNHSTEESYQERDVNLWRIAAYNKIWYDEYRQQYYDDGIRFLSADVDPNIATIFNFDDLDCSTAATANVLSSSVVTPAYRVQEMFQMRYRCWKKDLLTGIMPSTQYGAVSSVPISVIQPSKTGDDLNRWKNVTQGSIANTPGVPSVGTSQFGRLTSNGNDGFIDYIQHDHTIGTISGSYDILELRKATAIQLWRERALTAGNRVSDNFRSHYGSDAVYDDHRATFLGSVDAPLTIQDINSTAQIGSGANQGLADVAGKGTSTMSDKVFKFKAHEFGVIVAMFSLLPEAEYQSDGIDRMNQLLEWEDYFVPELQNLGLEGVSRLTFYHDPDLDSGTIIGYGPRYWGYKQKLDKCFEGFKSSQPFAPWASPKTDVAQIMSSTFTSMPLALLYVDPALYDRNFQVGVANSEQFLCDIYFDVSAVRQMSVVGLPNV